MGRCGFIPVALSGTVALIAIACLPQVAPPPVATSPPVIIPATLSPTVTPTLPLETAAWAKIVEAAKREGMVTNYSFYFVSDIGQALAKAFEGKYGIRVETMVSSGRALREKVRVEQRVNQPIDDLAQSGVSTAVEITQDGLANSVVDELPELKNREAFIIDPVYDPDKMILLFAPEYSDALINTRLVKPEDEPVSFYDLLEPRWKGKVVFTDPRGGGGGGYQWFTITRFYKVLDDDYFRRFVRQGPAFFGGADSEIVLMVARGEYAFSPRAGGTTAAPVAAEGAPIKTLSLKEGTTVQGQSFTVLKRAPHPNAARLFANWLMSQEGQLIYARAASRSSIRKDVPDFLHPNARSQPKRQLVRTHEAVLAADRDLKSGIIEEIFGSR